LKPLLLFALLLWQSAPVPVSTNQQYLRFQRTITVPAPGQSCAVIDPQLFPHAGPSLKDLRLFQSGQPIPYAITLSEPQQPDSDTAQIRNLGLRNRNIVFDVEMPARPYTDAILDLAGQDFLATATVSGTRDPNYANQTHLGDFTLFDLTSQHLSRSTTLHLQETNLPYLHIELSLASAPNTEISTATPQHLSSQHLSSQMLNNPEVLLKIVKGVTVPPSREAQSIYTTAARTTTITQNHQLSVATFNLPERIPIERVSFDIAPTYKANFSRDVHISDHPADSPAESLTGTILRVNLTQAGREIRQQQLSVPATLGSNMQSSAIVSVMVDNGDDHPLPITAVRLETRQREICFEAPSTQPLTLFYGDPALTAPVYDYDRLFTQSAAFHTAQLGPEQFNPAYHSRPDTRPITERNPHLLWIVLLAVICILAIIAIRSSRTIHH
jgi:Protein of unknown function (DUF3999)